MTNKEKKICEKFSKRDENGKVHCYECPLIIDKELCLCKANTKMRYNRKSREWEIENDM